MDKIKCIIIDDEPPAVQLMEKYCSMTDQLDVVATFQNAVKAFTAISELNIDLIFLDIQMPVLNGIQFLKSLKNPPSVIFTTAYRDYAVEGFDLDIIDYLLKPISFDRFLKSIDRYRLKVSSEPPKEIETSSQEVLFFNINKTHRKIVVDDIQYLESLKDYVRIHTKDEKLVVKGNLGSVLKKISKGKLIRIHRSFAIAFHALKAYNQRSVEINGENLPIGESYREDFKKNVEEYQSHRPK